MSDKVSKGKINKKQIHENEIFESLEINLCLHLLHGSSIIYYSK